MGEERRSDERFNKKQSTDMRKKGTDVLNRYLPNKKEESKKVEVNLQALEMSNSTELQQ